MPPTDALSPRHTDSQSRRSDRLGKPRRSFFFFFFCYTRVGLGPVLNGLPCVCLPPDLQTSAALGPAEILSEVRCRVYSSVMEQRRVRIPVRPPAFSQYLPPDQNGRVTCRQDKTASLNTFDICSENRSEARFFFFPTHNDSRMQNIIVNDYWHFLGFRLFGLKVTFFFYWFQVARHLCDRRYILRGVS